MSSSPILSDAANDASPPRRASATRTPSTTARSCTSWSRSAAASPAPSTARPRQTRASRPTRPAPAPELSIAFERVARTLRRTIALARKLADPAHRHARPSRSTSAASLPASRSSATSRTPSTARRMAAKPRPRRCTPSSTSGWTRWTSTTTSTPCPLPRSSQHSAATWALTRTARPAASARGSAAGPRTCARWAPGRSSAPDSPAHARPVQGNPTQARRPAPPLAPPPRVRPGTGPPGP